MNEIATPAAEYLVENCRAEIRSNGLIIEESLSPIEWMEGVVKPLRALIATSRESMLWWWGDVLAFGERKYGEMYSQALEGSDYTDQSLRIAKMVSERLPLFSRLNNLSWSHHSEVALGIADAAERSSWLERAVSEGWSKSKLRSKIRESKAEYKDEPNEDAGRFGPVKLANDLEAYFAKEDLQSWSAQRCAYWIPSAIPLAESLTVIIQRGRQYVEAA